VEAAVPGGEEEIVPGEHEGSGEMQGAQAAQLAGDRELGGVFHQALVHFDHAERSPLLAHLPAGYLAFVSLLALPATSSIVWVYLVGFLALPSFSATASVASNVA
jgi:hypothetical protein